MVKKNGKLFFANSGNRTLHDVVALAPHRIPGRFLHSEIKRSCQADAAQDTYRIFLKADVGVANATDEARIKIHYTTHVVKDAEVSNAVIKRVHREVAAKGILGWRAKGIVARYEEAAAIFLCHLFLSFPAKGGDLYYLAALKQDVRDAETTTD